MPRHDALPESLKEHSGSTEALEGDLRDRVRARYAQAAAEVTAVSGRTALEVVDADQCCAAPGDTGSSCCSDGHEVGPGFGGAVYSSAEQGELPAEAVAASLGCGNPMMVAELREGETVLDLGSGGGIDVLLSARRVGPTGFAYGVDMTDEMLQLARANAAKAGATNVEFLKGTIEDVPLPGRLGRRGHLQLRHQPVHATSPRCSPRCSACSGPAAGSGSPTSSPRTT